VLGQNVTVLAVEQSKVPQRDSHPLDTLGAEEVVRRKDFAEQFEECGFALPPVRTIELSPALTGKLWSCVNAHALLYLSF